MRPRNSTGPNPHSCCVDGNSALHCCGGNSGVGGALLSCCRSNSLVARFAEKMSRTLKAFPASGFGLRSTSFLINPWYALLTASSALKPSIRGENRSEYSISVVLRSPTMVVESVASSDHPFRPRNGNLDGIKSLSLNLNIVGQGTFVAGESPKNMTAFCLRDHNQFRNSHSHSKQVQSRWISWENRSFLFISIHGI